MTTTYASIYLEVNGQDYLFTVDATDTTANESMVNLVSSQSIGDTFPTGARITAVGPLLLNSSGGSGASKSILGAILLDPNNNVVMQQPYTDCETQPIPLADRSHFYPVGLNYRLVVTTTNA